MPHHHKTKLSPAAQARTKTQLQSLQTLYQWQPKAEQHCAYRWDGTAAGGAHGGCWVRVKQFTNGTLYVEAAEAKDLTTLLQALGLEAAPTPALATGESSAPPTGTAGLVPPYVGCDESGKGDYFGPLVAACVWVTPTTAQQLQALGVADCKTLTNAKVQALGPAILQVVGPHALALVELPPAQYNTVYAQFVQRGKKLNALLAHVHASALAALCQKLANEGGEASPTFPPTFPLTVLVDQFANPSVMHTALQACQLGSGHLRLLQQPKAEAFIAVAAASIIARHRFLQRMEELSAQAGLNLPLGASEAVLRAARQLHRQVGSEGLQRYVKWHFKSTQSVVPY
jgi:ribonuclease HIII